MSLNGRFLLPALVVALVATSTPAVAQIDTGTFLGRQAGTENYWSWIPSGSQVRHVYVDLNSYDGSKPVDLEDQGEIHASFTGFAAWVS
ncbi:MAG: hypothetical protein AAF533_26470, partial [Acidobacteriota bacterium]